VLRGIAFGLLFASLSPVAAQVRIDVSVPTIKTEGIPKIQATVRNKGKQPITVCVDVGYRSVRGNISGITPQPFLILQQPRNTSNWNTVHNRTDPGEFQARVIQSGESVDFPFQPAAPGHLRLVLHYWIGSASSIDCAKEEAGARKAKSKDFDVPSYVEFE
jgi:hypothetical protein